MLRQRGKLLNLFLLCGFWEWWNYFLTISSYSSGAFSVIKSFEQTSRWNCPQGWEEMSFVERTIYKQTFALVQWTSLQIVPGSIFLSPFSLSPAGIQWEQGKCSSVNMVNRPLAVPEQAVWEGMWNVKSRESLKQEFDGILLRQEPAEEQSRFCTNTLSSLILLYP